MKRSALIPFTFILIFAVLACDFAGMTIDLGGGGSPEEEAHFDGPPVEAVIDAPANGSALMMGPVDVAYHATSNEGVSEVELSIDGSVVSSIASPDASQKVVALKYTWNPPSGGNHVLQVRAKNKDGAWSNFSTASVTIQGAQPPAQPAQPQAQPQTQPQQQPAAPEPTKTPEPTATPDKVTFFDIKHDKDKFYYGSGACGSREITISTRVTLPEKVFSVVLFTRFSDKEGGGNTKWDAGHAMSKKGDDLYSITLASDKITNYNTFEFAALGYQFVATDKQRNNIARTESFYDIAYEICP